MNVLHCIIGANVTCILFNVIGMSSGMKPPPSWAYIPIWLVPFGILAFISFSTYM